MYREHVEISAEENRIAQVVYDAAQEIFNHLGPGLLESVYEECLAHELTLRGMNVERQVPLTLVYKDLVLKDCFRIDLWVNRKIVVELKSVSEMKDIFKAQLNTYLRITNCNLGILINFNVRFLGEGYTRWIVR